MSALTEMLVYIEEHGGTLLNHKNYMGYWKNAIIEQHEQEAIIARLRADNANLLKKLDALTAWYEDGSSPHTLYALLEQEIARLQKAVEVLVETLKETLGRLDEYKGDDDGYIIEHGHVVLKEYDSKETI